MRWISVQRLALATLLWIPAGAAFASASCPSDARFTLEKLSEVSTGVVGRFGGGIAVGMRNAGVASDGNLLIDARGYVVESDSMGACEASFRCGNSDPCSVTQEWAIKDLCGVQLTTFTLTAAQPGAPSISCSPAPGSCLALCPASMGANMASYAATNCNSSVLCGNAALISITVPVPETSTCTGNKVLPTKFTTVTPN